MPLFLKAPVRDSVCLADPKESPTASRVTVAISKGDEMIRTDRMSYPLQLGTGTEDYFNGGWYFLGAHSNPMSGQPRFVVNDPEDGWSHARFEHSLYRNHIADPIVGRSGMRFGFEAGETGSYTPVRYRTLGLAYYAFDCLIESYGRTCSFPPRRSAAGGR